MRLTNIARTMVSRERLTNALRTRWPETLPDSDVEVARRLAQYSVLSLDVFDTALVRLVSHPADIFEIVEHDYRARHPSTPAFGFADLRVAAEVEARRADRRRADGETTLDEIYGHLRLPSDWPEGVAQELEQIELAVEVEFCRVNPRIKRVYDRARDNGMQVIFMSDMYLPSSTIAEMLASVGYQHEDHLFVSSGHPATKRSGELYALAAQTLDVRPEDILHIGDNRVVDVAGARSSGVSALWYRAPLDHSRLVNYELTESIRRALASIRRLQLGTDTELDDRQFWKQFGYENVGILYLGFAIWLRQQLLADGIERVFFLSRDGQILQRVFDRLPSSARSTYLYVSRRSLNFASIRALDEQALAFLGSPFNGIVLTVAEYLRLVDLDPRDHLDAVERVGFATVDHEISTADDFATLHALLLDLEPTLLEQARLEKSSLVPYLQQAGMTDGGRIAVVDIGWHGSMQRSLESMLREIEPGTEVYGYYVATLQHVANLKAQGQVSKGFLADAGAPLSRANSVLRSFAIWEFLHQARHGSVVRIRTNGDEYEPVLAANDWGDEELAVLDHIQSGALEFVDDMLEVIRTRPSVVIPAATAAAPIERLIEWPTRREARMFGDLMAPNGFGSVFRRVPIAKPPSIVAILRSPGSVRPLHAASFWPRGFRQRLVPGSLAVQEAVSRVRGVLRRTLHQGTG